MAVIAAVTSFFSFVLGYMVYRQNSGKKESLLFLWLSLILGTWSLIAVFAYSAPDLAKFILLYRIASILQILYLGTFLHFAIIISTCCPQRNWLVYLVYIPCAAAIPFLVAGTGPPDNYIQIGQMWCFNQRFLSSTLLCPAVIWILYYSASAGMYFHRARKAPTLVERRIFNILGFLIVLILAGTLLEGIIFPAAFDTTSIGPDLLFKFAWLLCVGLLVDRYQFLSTSEKLEELALAEFPECAIFVLDERCFIKKANQEASSQLSLPPEALKGTAFEALIPAGKRLLREMEELKRNGISSLSGMVDFIGNETSRHLMDMKVSLIYNRNRATIGFIIIAKPVQQRQPLESIMTLSAREIDMVEALLQGNTNREIAELLGISERTVKSHLTHIFGKLGIKNRNQLYTLLRANHYISEHCAEKNLLVLQNFHK
jgi:DNA-binding CsgD family transcriptional regulator